MNALVSTVAVRPMPLKRARTLVRTRVAVIPEMSDMLSYVCPVFSQCAGMFIGTEEHQREIITNFHALADHYNIAHSEPYVLRALLAGDKDLAVSLAESTDMYNDIVEIIRRLIVSIPELPVDTSPSV
ncbi:hypothetical protein ATCVCanal1_045R [Acanthocystis turfacea Chlorella virus Canal-1]|nr:hypothetical protein ATCVCanal1_045R [Acanthocystis turfacea Chlorella virus Canal-1]